MHNLCCFVENDVNTIEQSHSGDQCLIKADLSSCLFHIGDSGSRDSKMALWCIKDDKDSDASTTSVSHIPMRSPDYGYDIVTPLTVKSCKKAEKVRALGYNHNNHVRTQKRHILLRNWCFVKSFES